MADLRAAAQAVLDRWDSPKWEWAKHGPTADLMAELRAALAQAEPVQFNPAEALRLAEEFAQMKQAHGVFCNADSRRLMEEAHSALAAYLGIKGGGNG